MAGYSNRALREKLGLKVGSKALFINEPKSYIKDLKDISDIVFEKDEGLDFVHLFAKDNEELLKNFKKAKRKIHSSGMIWASWPKLSQKIIKSDLNENIVRDLGLSLGFVDVKVAAIDEIWSGLKFVIPLLKR